MISAVSIHCDTRFEGSAPFLTRIAGLPITTLEAFASHLVSETLADYWRCETTLKATRTEMADRLYRLIPGLSIRLRRYFLAIRRDCFNGRSLADRQSDPEWSALRERAGELSNRLLFEEEDLQEARKRLAAEYDHQRALERRHMQATLGRGSFLRGIALASVVLAENVPHLSGTPPSAYGRKETRLEGTLLRYISRAAFKLSPFSTLTRVALGAVKTTPGAPCLSLLESSWPETSLLRLKRYLLDQCWELLQSQPPVRDCLTLALNNTNEEIAPGRYRFLRPGFWALSPDGSAFRFSLPTVIKTDLGGPVVSWLLRELPERRPAWDKALASLAQETRMAQGDILDVLNRLLQLGFLRLLPPWPIHELHLEKQMALFLREVPGERLNPIASILESVVALEEEFHRTSDPACLVLELERRIDELWRAAASFGGVDPGVDHSRLQTGSYYEDVFLQPAADGEERYNIVRLQPEVPQRLLSGIFHLMRILGPFNLRHEFLLTLEAFMARKWPGQQEVGVMELFGAIQPLWLDYMRFVRTARVEGRGHALFNPMELEAIWELIALRRQVMQKVSDLLEPDATGTRIDVSRLAALATTISKRWAPPVGPCLFLQPADGAGHLWVVNRIDEGTGRYGSRFTAVMNEKARRAYTTHLAAQGTMADGRELLDLMCPQGDTLNVHTVQTRWVLEMPGESVDLFPESRVSLRDLRVRRGEPEELLVIVDASGRRFLPAHLGGAGFDFLPTPLKILCLLGAGEMRLQGLPRPPRHDRDMTVWDRLILGNVVLLRKRWSIAPNPLAGTLENLSDVQAFAAINRWRLDQGLPDRVVLVERIHYRTDEERYKPQYLDFTSPLFVALFRSAMRQNRASLTFEEVLPAPDAVPRDEKGQAWAVEIMLDTLSLGLQPDLSETTSALGIDVNGAELPLGACTD